MKRYALLILAAATAACNSSEEFVSARVSQPADRIVEYTPAPGQFINEPQSGFTDVTTPEAACAYAEQRIAQGAYVSLGGWGGTLVARSRSGQSITLPQSGIYVVRTAGGTLKVAL